MQNVDLINGLFELVGITFAWANVRKLRKEKEVKGVFWPGQTFWVAWGFWNLIYYPIIIRASAITSARAWARAWC